MAQHLRIRCVVKTDRMSAHKCIHSVGGVKPDGSRWTLTQDKAISEIEDGTRVFYIEIPAGHRIKDSTNSRLASLRVGVPQKSAAYALTNLGSRLYWRIRRHSWSGQPGLPVARTIRVRRLNGRLLFPGGTGRTGEPAQLLNRTQSDSVGLAQSSIDGSGFGNTHLSAKDEGRNVGRISVAVSNEPSGRRALVDRGLKNPAVGKRIREAILNSSFDSETPAPLSDVQQT